jgi:hypothetical protein
VSVVAAVLVFLHVRGDARATSGGRCLKGFVDPHGHGCWMLGDVDGDGHDDAFAVVHRRLANGKERLFLVVKTRNETLRSWIGDIGDPYPDGANVAAIAPIDSSAGNELIVQDWRSASEAGYTLYTVRKGRLLQIRTPYGYGYIQVGGYAGSGEDDVSCPYGPSKGVLLVGGSYLYASKHRVEVRRELWRLEGTRFVLMRDFKHTYSRKELGPDAIAPAHIPGFPALDGWEFAGCSVFPGDKAL